MKSENDGQTFKKMVGQLVLPADMHVYDDPTLRKYAGEDLNGFYKYDDQGVKAERVDVVVNGKLNDFLMTVLRSTAILVQTVMRVPAMGLILFPASLIW